MPAPAKGSKLWAGSCAPKLERRKNKTPCYNFSTSAAACRLFPLVDLLLRLKILTPPPKDEKTQLEELMEKFANLKMKYKEVRVKNEEMKVEFI